MPSSSLVTSITFALLCCASLRNPHFNFSMARSWSSEFLQIDSIARSLAYACAFSHPNSAPTHLHPHTLLANPRISSIFQTQAHTVVPSPRLCVRIRKRLSGGVPPPRGKTSTARISYHSIPWTLFYPTIEIHVLPPLSTRSRRVSSVYIRIHVFSVYSFDYGTFFEIGLLGIVKSPCSF